MKLRSIFLMLLISAGFFSLSLLCAYLFWWTEYYDGDSFKLKYVFIFFSIGGSAMFLDILIALMIVLPRKANIDATIFFERERFFSIISSKKIKLFKIVVVILHFLLAIIFFGLFYFIVDNYEYYQLKTYGQRSKVVIQEVRKTRKELPFALVEFENQGRACSKELFTDEYREGDTVEIIFSTKKVQIVKWYDEFVKGK